LGEGSRGLGGVARRHAVILSTAGIQAAGAGHQPGIRKAFFSFAQARGSLYVRSVPEPPSLQAIRQDLRQQKTGNPLTDLLVSLLLTLLTGFLAGLAELMERIKSGEYQPSPIPPRQEQATPHRRQRTPRPQSHRWPAEMRPESAGHPGQPAPSPQAPEPAPVPAPPHPAGTARRRQRHAAPDARPAPAAPRGAASAFPAVGPPRKARREPAAWHAVIITI
jgi:hypothetical protein